MKCSCPIWCDGELNGRRFRKSVGLRDWSRAVKRVERWEEKPGEAIAIPSLQDCIESYLGDCRARNLKTSTVASYKKTLEHFEAFCGTMHVDQTDLGLLTDFRASRHVKASTSGKELETLWAFCAFAKKRGWIAENYARELDPPREEGLPTLPFGGDEVETILGACGKLEDDNPNTRERTRNRARALCLVLLYSGVSAGIKQHQFSRFWCCQDRR